MESLDIIRAYDGKERVCGLVDCNILFMEIYEPESAKQLKGKYNTIIQGAKLAKKITGFSSVSRFLEGTPEKYKQVSNNFTSFGDIGVTTEGHHVVIHTGSHIFGVIEHQGTEIFGCTNVLSHNFDNYKFYRRCYGS